MQLYAAIVELCEEPSGHRDGTSTSPSTIDARRYAHEQREQRQRGPRRLPLAALSTLLSRSASHLNTVECHWSGTHSLD